MRIWKVICSYKWEDDNSSSSYSFGSYDGALLWIINHGDDLKWASIEENNYLPCKKDNPDGQLYISANVFQFFGETGIQAMKYVHEHIKID